MRIELPQISSQIYPDETLNIILNKYVEIGPPWIVHQLEWTNNIFKAFKDHDKYLIIIYLIKKTLDFYARNFTKLSYNEFYSKDTVEIEKFNIIEIAKNINIPKESARRKILELEAEGIIKRIKKKIIIDRSAFGFIKPTKAVIRTSRFLALLSNILFKNKVMSESLSSEMLEKVIKDNFTYVWRDYYELQIPMMLSYKKVFGDIEAWAIWGTCVVNEHLHTQKVGNVTSRTDFLNNLSNKTPQGLNAMSISDITGIPRATVVRKLKKLINKKMLTINNKKQYKLTSAFIKKIEPVQAKVLNKLAEFSSKIFNLAIL